MLPLAPTAAAEAWYPAPTPPPTCPYQRAVLDAADRMQAATTYPAWRNAQADYNEARAAQTAAHDAALDTTPHYFIEA